MSSVTPDEEQLKKELEAMRSELDKEREEHKRALELNANYNRSLLESERDAFAEAIQHLKLRSMTRIYESMADILKMESAINDPKSLFGKKNDV